MSDLNDRPTALYRFYDRRGGPLYFGIAVDPPGRWLLHRSAPWWAERDESRTCIDWYPDRPSARKAERAAIRAERPRHNREHADYHPPLGVGVSDLRIKIADVVNATAVDGQITYITNRGRRIAAIVPVRDGDEAVRRRDQAD